MSRFEIVDSKLMPGMSKAWNVWTVTENDAPIHVALTKVDAEHWLTRHKEKIGRDCVHAQMSAEREVAERYITLECERCGMVGELEFDIDVVNWIGQQ